MAGLTINEIDLQDIYDFMQNGNPNNAPQHIVDYLNLLDKTRSMKLRIDQYGSKEAIVKHLMITEKISRYKASQVHDEAVEYFYTQDRISKKAWKNLYADGADKMINFAAQMVRTVDDALKVVKMYKEVADLREVHVEDKSDLSEDLFKAPMVIYTMNPEDLGLPKANRQKLSEFIDSLPELTEKERVQIKREAQVLPIKVFTDESENPRKS